MCSHIFQTKKRQHKDVKCNENANEMPLMQTTFCLTGLFLRTKRTRMLAGPFDKISVLTCLLL